MRYDCENIPCTLPDCDCEIALDYVDQLQVPELGNLETVRVLKIEEMTAEGEIKDIVSIAVPKESRLQRILEAGLNTLAGRNRVGKVIGRMKDELGLLSPLGAVIDRSTDLIGNFLFKPKPKRGQNMNWLFNRLGEKSTWRGIIAVGAGVGITLNPEQADAIVALGVAGIGVFEAFFKEPQSPDA